MFEIPEVSPYFYYGPVISYEFLGNVSKDKGKYRFRYELTFQNGEVIKKQQSGFDSIKEANQKKELLVHEILSGKYCPFDFTVQEFYNYWLFKILDEKNAVTVHLRNIKQSFAYIYCQRSKKEVIYPNLPMSS